MKLAKNPNFSLIVIFALVQGGVYLFYHSVIKNYLGSVIKTKSKLDRSLGNLWTSISLLRWVILRGQMLF